MSLRKTSFVEGEYYHIYNRGVDKRDIFGDLADTQRFLLSMQSFNTIDPVGSIYELQLGSLASKPTKKNNPLIHIIAYCLNPNHYHFLLEQNAEKGIEKFMQRLGTGYTKYFNARHIRSGSLFQGTFKSIHIDSNDYLLRVASYINLNHRVHQLGSLASKLVCSSWNEYTKGTTGFCRKDIILEQFNDEREYKKFAEESLEDTLEKRKQEKEIKDFLME